MFPGMPHGLVQDHSWEKRRKNDRPRRGGGKEQTFLPSVASTAYLVYIYCVFHAADSRHSKAYCSAADPAEWPRIE